MGGRGAVEVRCVGPDLRLELGEEGASLLNRFELQVDDDVVRVVDPVANLDGGYAALGSKVVEGSERCEPRLEVVDGVFDVK